MNTLSCPCGRAAFAPMLALSTRAAGLCAQSLAAALLFMSGTAHAAPAASAFSVTPGNGSALLQWSPAAGAASYDIYQGTSSGQETPVAQGVQGTSLTLTGLSNGTAYFFEVAAVAADGSAVRSPEVQAAPLADADTVSQHLDSLAIDSGNTPVGGADAQGFSNTVSVYYTQAATRAIVFLHGGGGTGDGVAFDLGLNLDDGTPTDDTVNWSWLVQHQAMAVFPQGASLDGTGSATWNNWVMDSGQNDVQMLQALAAYIRSRYGVSKVYLAGHSNGGMMVNRMWCESPDTFDGYVALSGPPSTHYQAACNPDTFKPYFGIAGGQDTVLQTAGVFAGPTWTVSSSIINATDPSSLGFSTYDNPDLIGEFQQQQARAAMMCNQALGDGVTDTAGLNTVWTSCQGRLKLQEVILANHWISHVPGTVLPDPTSLEAEAGYSARAGSTGLLDVVEDFIVSIEQ